MKKEKISRAAAGKTSLSRMIFRMAAVLMGIVAVGIIVSAFLSGYIRKQAEESPVNDGILCGTDGRLLQRYQ